MKSLTDIMEIVAETSNRIKILDFGGGSGSGTSFEDSKEVYGKIITIQSLIFDLPEVVKGNALGFSSFDDLPDGIDIIYSSWTIQCMQTNDYRREIQLLARVGARFLLFENTFLIIESSVRRDHFGDDIYTWFINEDEFVKYFTDVGYELIFMEKVSRTCLFESTCQSEYDYNYSILFQKDKL